MRGGGGRVVVDEGFVVCVFMSYECIIIMRVDGNIAVCKTSESLQAVL